jgi:hypothetical protein
MKNENLFNQIEEAFDLKEKNVDKIFEEGKFKKVLEERTTAPLAGQSALGDVTRTATGATGSAIGGIGKGIGAAARGATALASNLFGKNRQLRRQEKLKADQMAQDLKLQKKFGKKIAAQDLKKAKQDQRLAMKQGQQALRQGQQALKQGDLATKDQALDLKRKRTGYVSPQERLAMMQSGTPTQTPDTLEGKSAAFKEVYSENPEFKRLVDKIAGGQELTSSEADQYENFKRKIEGIKTQTGETLGGEAKKKAKQEEKRIRDEERKKAADQAAAAEKAVKEKEKKDYQITVRKEIDRLDPDLRALLAARNIVQDYVEYKIDKNKTSDSLRHGTKPSEFQDDVFEVVKTFIFGGDLQSKDGQGSVALKGDDTFEKHRQDKKIFLNRFDRDVMKLIPTYMNPGVRTRIANRIKEVYDTEVAKIDKDGMPKLDDDLKAKLQGKIKDEMDKDKKLPSDEKKKKIEPIKLSAKAKKAAISNISKNMTDRAAKIKVLSPEKYVESIFKKRGPNALRNPKNVARNYNNYILKKEREKGVQRELKLEHMVFEERIESLSQSLLSKDIITK